MFYDGERDVFLGGFVVETNFVMESWCYGEESSKTQVRVSGTTRVVTDCFV